MAKTQLPFDELNIMARSVYETIPVDPVTGKRRPDVFLDWFEDYLIDSYLYGVRECGIDYPITPDISKLQDALTKRIDGKTYEERLRTYISEDDIPAIIKVVETEAHRITEQGTFDAGQQFIDATGKSVTKRWHTMEDDRVRATHDYIDLLEVPFEDDFYTFDADHAPAPGLFSNPDNNVNCRCWITLHTR